MVFSVKTFNNINQIGLQELGNRFQIDGDMSENPDAYIIRSQNLHNQDFPSNLKAIARAGAGTNNIPIEEASAQGIVVFNTPGANANAVKEAVIAALLLSARDYLGANRWVNTLTGTDIPKQIEAAWNISSHVQRVKEIKDIFETCDYITIHVPLTNETKHTFDAEAFSIMKKGTTIINFARAELVNNQELFEAIETGVVKRYITDFGDKELLNQKGITVFPHVGGSTDEAELNCAIMASQTIRCFMETGEITNSVNFPNVHQIQTAPFRITLINKNVPNIVAKISTAVSELGINIDNIINRSKGDYAYTLIDLDETDNNKISTLIEEFEGDENIVRVRLIAKKQ